MISDKLPHINHTAEFCVVGGGLAGLAAAVAAARHGTNTILIHDRPVLGGNASSECRMWISGARKDVHETGIVEELKLENNYRNPELNWHIWDTILYEIAHFQPNLTVLMNASACNVTMDKNTIKTVDAWQTTTQTWHHVSAKTFADCSGDSILAPLTGADFRIGREARAEFNEDIQPEQADNKTMGLSCLIQVRELTRKTTFIPPKWANKYLTDDDLPNRGHAFRGLNNFWWIELGGEDDSIHDTEIITKKLLAAALGVWDHIKNHGDHGADNWALDWIGFLPGKRESRRYLGDHILTQNDVRAEGRFHDVVAYGGWSMDDHHPGGLNFKGQPTIFHPAPSPYGIPFRCLYSRNIDNLLVAGRNISVTHAALSSTRVMGTCAILGQAAGTAAAIATKYNCTPRDVAKNHIEELQDILLDDDCFIPGLTRKIPEATKNATITASEGNPDVLVNGCDRPMDGNDNAWSAKPKAWVKISFKQETHITKVRIVFDSDLNRKGQGDCGHFEERNLLSNYPLNQPIRPVPKTLVKKFTVLAQLKDQSWTTVHEEDDAHQRLVAINVDVNCIAIKLVLHETWGDELCKLFAFQAS